MKTVLIRYRFAILFAGALLAFLPPLQADVTIRGQRRGEVDLYHARDLLGVSVVSADGTKLGVISDFVLNVGDQPRLTDAVVRSGVFGWFGPSRLVPIGALQLRGERCQARLSWLEFHSLSPLPWNLDAYLSQPANLAATDQACHVPARAAQGRYVTYTSLLHTRVIASDGTDVGFVIDALVSLNQGSGFYLGVVPTADPFGPEPGVWLEIPITSASPAYGDEIQVSVPYGDQLIYAPDADSLSDMSSTMTRLGRVYRLAVE